MRLEEREIEGEEVGESSRNEREDERDIVDDERGREGQGVVKEGK